MKITIGEITSCAEIEIRYKITEHMLEDLYKKLAKEEWQAVETIPDWYDLSQATRLGLLRQVAEACEKGMQQLGERTLEEQCTIAVYEWMSATFRKA